MRTQKFIIEYPADRPFFPINTFRFKVNQEYSKENLETLKGWLENTLRTLQFIPVK